jgi:hypothetical protein
MRKKWIGTRCTIDIIPEIVKRNPLIKEICLSAYKYVPHCVSEKGMRKNYFIERQEVFDLRKKILSLKIPKGWMLGLDSKVTMKNKICRHVPEIDFKCAVSDKNFERIKIKLSEVIRTFPGYLIVSGASYHYLGLRLLTEREWEKFIGLCLLCEEEKEESVIDLHWCGHQLIRGYSSLRILASDSKPEEPKIIAFFNN